MLFDTHRLLKKFRKEGYIVEATEDSRGNACWDVYYPSIHHDLATKKNKVTEKYVGKVERFPEGHPRTYFGRPFFYYTWQRNLKAQTEDYVNNAISVAKSTPRTTVRPQR
ncbi:hypothetical protein HYZ41_01360 [archaeon]|nr:hypothetical protein [archaeon]